jgi:hypothetical protein
VTALAPPSAWHVPPWTKLLLFTGGLALLAWVVARYPLAGIGQAAVALLPWGALAPALALAWAAAGAAATHALLGAAVPWAAVLWNRLVTDGYNDLVPGGFAGEVFRAQHLSGFIAPDRAVAATLDDRLVGDVIGLLYSSACIGVGLARGLLHGALADALAIYVVGASCTAVALGVLVESPVPLRMGGWLARRLGLRAGGAFPPPPARTIAVMVFWNLVARALGAAEVLLLLHLLGTRLDVADAFLAHGVLVAVSFVAAPVPGGVGVQEASSLVLFEALGRPGPEGVAFALARRGRILTLSLLGVAAHVVGRRAMAPGRPTGS